MGCPNEYVSQRPSTEYQAVSQTYFSTLDLPILDPATFVFVTIVLGITAALSIAGPAWRAARITRPSPYATHESEGKPAVNGLSDLNVK